MTEVIILSVQFENTTEPKKGDRYLTPDETGNWHIGIVTEDNTTAEPLPVVISMRQCEAQLPPCEEAE